MFMLINEKTGEIFPVKKGCQYTVGRCKADLVLLNDNSISAFHAVLESKKGDLLKIEDKVSKNGTYHNDGITKNNPIPKNTPTQLKEGDKIQFGILGNLWRVKIQNISLISSGINLNEFNLLQNILRELGGIHSAKWDNTCTYLTMNEIRITLKFMYALLTGVPIVNIHFWEDFLKVANKKKKGPLLVNRYIPPVNDILLAQQRIDFLNPMERQNLFDNKTFVFLNKKQFDIYSPIITKAKGMSKTILSGLQKTFLLKPNVIVIQYVPSTDSQLSQGTQTINAIAELLEDNCLRFIPEYEIALSIIHGSTEKYCNPSYKIISNILSSANNNSEYDLHFKNTSPLSIENINQLHASYSSYKSTNETSNRIDWCGNLKKRKIRDVLDFEQSTNERRLKITNSEIDTNFKKNLISQNRTNEYLKFDSILQMDEKDENLFNFSDETDLPSATEKVFNSNKSEKDNFQQQNFLLSHQVLKPVFLRQYKNISKRSTNDFKSFSVGSNAYVISEAKSNESIIQGSFCIKKFILPTPTPFHGSLRYTHKKAATINNTNDRKNFKTFVKQNFI